MLPDGPPPEKWRVIVVEDGRPPEKWKAIGRTTARRLDSYILLRSTGKRINRRPNLEGDQAGDSETTCNELSALAEAIFLFSRMAWIVSILQRKLNAK